MKSKLEEAVRERDAFQRILDEDRRKFERDRLAMTEEKEKTEEAQKRLETNLRQILESKEVIISKLEGRLRINVASRILFDTGSADLLEEGRLILDKLAKLVKADGHQDIRVEGHTDNVPVGKTLASKFPSNWELSACRATSAVRYLRWQGGISPERLSAAGYAETKPVAPNDTEENRAKNRRIEIILTPVGDSQSAGN